MAALTDAQKHAIMRTEMLRNGWQACRPLGQGTYGVVGIAVQHDNNQMITDRAAIKDCYYHNDNHWASHLTWTGAPATPAAPMLREIGAMLALQAANSRNIVRLRGHGENRAALRYRLVLEFCPKSDLIDAYEHYKNGIGQPIPEPAIWAILWGLMEACVVLEDGNVNGNPAPAGWQPIVHRDIKPDNIMLGDYPILVNDMNAPFRLYPVPKLGDFGFALQIDDANPPFTPGVSGAHRSQSPEQIYPQKRWKLSTKTNVFSIGITVLSLMGLSLDCAPPSLYRWKRTHKIKFPPGAAGYSQELRDVVQQCIAKNPTRRPTLAQLRILLETHCCGPEDKARGMYHLFPSQIATHRGGAFDLMGTVGARYAMGTVFV